MALLGVIRRTWVALSGLDIQIWPPMRTGHHSVSNPPAQAIPPPGRSI